MQRNLGRAMTARAIDRRTARSLNSARGEFDPRLPKLDERQQRRRQCRLERVEVDHAIAVEHAEAMSRSKDDDVHGACYALLPTSSRSG
jgi:hypothetical protein